MVQMKNGRSLSSLRGRGDRKLESRRFVMDFVAKLVRIGREHKTCRIGFQNAFYRLAADGRTTSSISRTPRMTIDARHADDRRHTAALRIGNPIRVDSVLTGQIDGNFLESCSTAHQSPPTTSTRQSLSRRSGQMGHFSGA